MGGRLTTPPSSAASSSTTTHRNLATNSSTNLSHPRTHSTGTGHHSSHHRHRSSIFSEFIIINIALFQLF